jgi:TetR/AcrR family transcriptional regulator, tetracycline repressor protein
MALTPDRIVDTAISLLERDGLEGVSFRKIAAELGVSGPTLYWHIDSKQQLLDLMAEQLMRRAGARDSLDPEPGEDWSVWLVRRTRAMYETLIAHRDAPRVVVGNRPTVDSLPHIEAALGALVDAGFAPGDAIEVMLTTSAFAIGCALEWQAEAAREIGPHPSDLATAVLTGDYPMVRRALGEHRGRHGPYNSHDHMFEHGLRMLVRGLQSSLEDGALAPARREWPSDASGYRPR